MGDLGGLGGLGDIPGLPGLGDSAQRHDTTPTTTQVTITTNPMTMMVVNGKPGGVGDMTMGDTFFAMFNGSPSDPIQTITASPALFILDHTPPAPKALYGFVGTVTGTNTTAGTVSVTMSDSIPSTLAAPGTSATFTVGDHTLILGGSTVGGSLEGGLGGLGGSLSNVSMGDIVAGVLVAPKGDTLTQVEAAPLNLLLDFPAPATSPAAAKAKAKALNDLMALIEGKAIPKYKTHRTHKKHSKHHSKSHKHAKKG